MPAVVRGRLPIALALALTSVQLAQPAVAASPAEEYASAPTFAGMGEPQIMHMLQEKMPLPILHLCRARKGGAFVYGIEMNPAGLPVKSNVLTVSFELRIDASADELIAAIDETAREVRMETLQVFQR